MPLSLFKGVSIFDAPFLLSLCCPLVVGYSEPPLTRPEASRLAASCVIEQAVCGRGFLEPGLRRDASRGVPSPLFRFCDQGVVCE